MRGLILALVAMLGISAAAMAQETKDDAKDEAKGDAKAGAESASPAMVRGANSLLRLFILASPDKPASI